MIFIYPLINDDLSLPSFSLILLAPSPPIPSMNVHVNVHLHCVYMDKSGQARTPLTSSYRRSAYMSTPSQLPSGSSQPMLTITPKTGGNLFVRTAADRNSPLPFSRSLQMSSSTTTTTPVTVTQSTDADTSLPLSVQDVTSYESQLRSQAAIIEATRSKVSKKTHDVFIFDSSSSRCSHCLFFATCL